MGREILQLEGSVNSGISAAATALAANEARVTYKIQNLGTNPLFVKEGASASVSDFTYVLAAGAGNDDGSGGSYDNGGKSVYIGVVTTAGTSPRYVASERSEK